MALKTLFASATKALTAKGKNEAGGTAYEFTPSHALAQYAATGTFNRTFYATEGEQLERVLELCRAVDPVFVAKTAVYARERARMKDMPAFLLAYLAAVDVRLLSLVFDRVIDNGKMLRNFVQIVRSGVVGRKSFGTAPKRLVRTWFDKRTPAALFRQSIGNDPSMKDVIKMLRPSPVVNGVADAEREALYGYLIGKDVAFERLPAVVQTFEAFKSGSPEVPDVPFEMLTALPLSREMWMQIARRMSFTQLRMNLNTLLRHGVFEHRDMIDFAAARLSDPDAVRKARVFPYQLLAAYTAAQATLPNELALALQLALEVSIENVPAVPGKVYVCPDVSGSMQSPVTGHRKGSSSKVRCVDVAGLVAAAFLRRNQTAEVIPFSDDVVSMSRRLNPLDSVMTNAAFLASLPSGGTACSAPLRHLNKHKAEGDLVIYVSDNQSWADFGVSQRATPMAEEWERFRKRSPNAKLVLIDVQPYGSTQVSERADVLNVGGFSDSVFEVVSLFAKGELDAEHWVGEIEKVALA
ncbi:MAG TPA: TROVE domain-containing protein [Polyangiaceae bacterium]|nr:TROVE domain-containing protein [Polyangiaceae bacterium]